MGLLSKGSTDLNIITLAVLGATLPAPHAETLRFHHVSRRAGL